jgi:hypothetical protein
METYPEYLQERFYCDHGHELDLIERHECARCEDRGYVTRTVEMGEHRITFTDPCPYCSK